MARLTQAQWEAAKADYEIGGFSYSQLVDKYGMSRGSISHRANKEEWKQGRVEHLVQKKANAIKEINEVEQQTEQMGGVQQVAIDNAVQKRLEAEEIFISAAKYNQTRANQLIRNKPDISMSEIEAHSRITGRNKETVLGKAPDTAIQINNQAQEPTINLTLHGSD